MRLDRGVATVTCACAEVGQGFVTIAQQFTREVLGVDEVVLAPADTTIGSAGSTSASRQTWMSGGAVKAAAEAVRERMLAIVAATHGVAPDTLSVVGDRIVSDDGTIDLPVAHALGDEVVEETVEYHHEPTFPLDGDGQGNAHLSFAFVAHRAVVDVDPELGLCRLVDLVTSQDVGKVLNPLQLLGQLEGGAAQGVGLALMEEILVTDGAVRNASFTDYLIPTALDLPDLRVGELVEQPEPGRAVRRQGRGRAAHHLLDPGRGRRRARRHRVWPWCAPRSARPTSPWPTPPRSPDDRPHRADQPPSPGGPSPTTIPALLRQWHPVALVDEITDEPTQVVVCGRAPRAWPAWPTASPCCPTCARTATPRSARARSSRATSSARTTAGASGPTAAAASSPPSAPTPPCPRRRTWRPRSCGRPTAWCWCASSPATPSRRCSPCPSGTSPASSRCGSRWSP